MSIPAIVLAAGASRRLGQPKQLVVFGGETLLERALRIAREADAVPVFAVLGANSAEIRAAASFEGALPVMNDEWARGISSSIQAGLNEVSIRAAEVAGAMIMPCDQPRLSTAHLRALVAAFESQAEPSIVASAYADTLGIPAVFPRKAFEALQALRGDTGARSLFVNPPCPVIAVPFEGGELDIDLPSDLDELG